ncbi:MAG: hypothetical protein U0871_01860 [Gemmataceae bacterium]
MSTDDELRDRRSAEVIHKLYFGLMTEDQAVAALNGCGVASADPERLAAALEVYDLFTHHLGAVMDPAHVTPD